MAKCLRTQFCNSRYHQTVVETHERCKGHCGQSMGRHHSFVLKCDERHTTGQRAG